MTPREQLALAIREAREGIDATRAEFAAAAMCSTDAVARWERGESVPRGIASLRYLESLGVDRSLIQKAWPKPDATKSGVAA